MNSERLLPRMVAVRMFTCLRATCAILLAGLLTLAPVRGHALESDRVQPIDVLADHAEFAEQTGTSIYQGHVTLRQGSIEVKADRVTLVTRERRLVRVVAQGQPARYRQQLTPAGEVLTAEARVLRYFPAQDRIVLEGQAVLVKGDNTVRSDRIVYDLGKGRVQAGKPGSGERVHIVIQPATGDKPAAPGERNGGQP